MRTATITVETYAAHATLAALENAVRDAGKGVLFVGAPLVGLAFVLALPLFGLGVLGWLAAKTLAARRRAIGRFLKHAGLFVAAPFIGLAYALTLPFVGIAALVWIALEARHA